MSGIGARSAATFALAALTLALTASGGTAAASNHGPFLGVVPHTDLFGSPRSAANPATPTGPVVYHGGQVMHTNTAYTIFWFPGGSTFSANYESLINRYFQDVAAASNSPTNVYSTATQYYDKAASIQYLSAFGGSYVDTNPFPPNGCSVAPVCLTDAQLQAEIQKILTIEGWHGSTSVMFFLMTPRGVDSCFDSSGAECTTNRYCAYHSYFVDTSGELVIYANQPYNAPTAGCYYGESPNGDDADATINTISHEHIEAITDPLGDAWYSNDATGDEVADICLGNFGTAIGGAPGAEYNQVINGHEYWLQQEYSNDNSGCVQHYAPTTVPASFSAPTVSGSAVQGQTLSSTAGSWQHAPTGYTYQWLRCAASGTGCANISGAAGSTYQLTAADGGQVVRSQVTATNGAGTSAPAASTNSSVVIPVPAATAPPVISGVAAAGKSLSVSTGTWNTPATFTYQWLSCNAKGTGCAPVAGATDNSYFLLGADAGHTLQVVVTATNAAGTGQTLSKRSALIVGVPHLKKHPRISGRARVRGRLTVSKGTWSGPPRSYRYQWLRCNARGGGCRSIRRATHPTYRVSSADVGHRFRVRVTAINAAGRKTATSGASGRIAA